MLKCTQATLLLSESQDRPLTLSERLSLRAHLLMCTGCRNFSQQLPVLRGIARRYARGVQVLPQEDRRPDGDDDAGD